MNDKSSHSSRSIPRQTGQAGIGNLRVTQAEVLHAGIDIRQIVIGHIERFAILLIQLGIGLAKFTAQRLRLSHSTIDGAQIGDERPHPLAVIHIHEAMREPGALAIQLGKIRVLLQLLTPVPHELLERDVVIFVQTSVARHTAADRRRRPRL